LNLLAALREIATAKLLAALHEIVRFGFAQRPQLSYFLLIGILSTIFMEKINFYLPKFYIDPESIFGINYKVTKIFYIII
jgi:hypothetical protein